MPRDAPVTIAERRGEICRAHPTFVSLDNEPDIWYSTHEEIQGSATVNSQKANNLPSATFISKTVALAEALKDQFPAVTIFGPVNYGFNGIYGWQGDATLSPTPSGTNWFQLYVQASPTASRRLVERAAAAGYRAIVVTVDLPLLGHRLRDRRNGWELSVPLGNFASDPTIQGDGPSHRPDATGYDTDASLPTLTWHDLEAIRSWSCTPCSIR